MGKKTIRYHKPVTYEAKVRKSKAYFKNYETKLRRRRECKTDFAQRRGLIRQDKNKYNTPKYRFVVRFTNKDIICQIISSKIDHDEVHCSAYSHELPRYGLTVGLTNYAAAYATGLLCARRMLASKTAKGVNLAECYKGMETEGVDGSNEWLEFLEEPDEGDPEPFNCYLDLGLSKPSTGSKIFAALKGGVDGGLFIPHNARRFVGSCKAKDEDQDQPYDFDPEVMRKYIFGGHVAEYMRFLQESNDKKYSAHFSKYIAAGVGPDDLEDLYKAVFNAIRADPSFQPTSTAAGGKSQRAALDASKGAGSYHKSGECKRITRAEKGKPGSAAQVKYQAERRARRQKAVRAKIAEWKAAGGDEAAQAAKAKKRAEKVRRQRAKMIAAQQKADAAALVAAQAATAAAQAADAEPAAGGGGH